MKYGKVDEYAALFGKFDRVADNIEQDLPDTAIIQNHLLRKIACRADADINALFVRAWAEELHHILRQAANIGFRCFKFDARSIHARIVEHIIEKIEQARAASANGRNIVSLRRREFGLGQKRGHAQNAVQRRSDFMAD